MVRRIRGPLPDYVQIVGYQATVKEKRRQRNLSRQLPVVEVIFPNRTRAKIKDTKRIKTLVIINKVDRAYEEIA